MTSISLTLDVNPSQAEQLACACAAYRAYAWRELDPSPERNQIMKAIQAVQGRVSQERAQGFESLRLVVCEEEKQALRQAVYVLMRVYGSALPSRERNQALGELASVRLLLERACRQTQALP